MARVTSTILLLTALLAATSSLEHQLQDWPVNCSGRQTDQPFKFIFNPHRSYDGCLKFREWNSSEPIPVIDCRPDEFFHMRLQWPGYGINACVEKSKGVEPFTASSGPAGPPQCGPQPPSQPFTWTSAYGHKQGCLEYSASGQVEMHFIAAFRCLRREILLACLNADCIL